jgi:hypothetical protein
MKKLSDLSQESRREILQSIERKPKKGIKCINHRKTQAIMYCENCGKPICSECMIINWRSNFVGAAFMAEKEKFVKDIVCNNCAKAINKGQTIFSLALLVLFLSIIMAMAIGAI